jgi:hypothetical protein
VALLLISVACASAKRTNMGYGFELVTRVDENAKVWEGYVYHQDLRYRGTSLGEVGFVSIAPSGRFALYEQEGQLLLFSTESGKIRIVPREESAMPRYADWLEDKGLVVVSYQAESEPTEILLGP